MEGIELTEVLLLLGLVFLGFWRRHGWLLFITGVATMVIAVQFVGVDDGISYGLAYIGLGLCMIIYGAFRFDDRGAG